MDSKIPDGFENLFEKTLCALLASPTKKSLTANRWGATAIIHDIFVTTSEGFIHQRAGDTGNGSDREVMLESPCYTDPQGTALRRSACASYGYL